MPKTGFSNLGVTVPAKADKPIAIPGALEAFAESLGNGQGKGKLLIAQNTGAAAWKAMQGDGTLAEDGTLTLANAASIYQAGAVTVTSASLASFSTPIKVTLPRVLANQAIEIVCFGRAKSSIECKTTEGSVLAVSVGGVSQPGEFLGMINGGTLAAGTQVGFFTLPSVTQGLFAKSSTVGELEPGKALFNGMMPVYFVAAAEAANVVVEIKGSGGTVTAEKVWFRARAIG